MSEKAVKSKIEAVITDVLNGDALKHALDFVAYLRANKISLSRTYPDTWNAKYKGKVACTVILQNKGLRISLRGDYSKGYEGILVNEKMKQSIIDHLSIKPCRACNQQCSDGISASLFGKEYHKICKHVYNTTYFNIADANAVECAKLIIEKACDDLIAI